MPPTDDELLERWRAGDLEAGSVLFERHYDAVCRFFRNKAWADAPDLVQVTFLGLVQARDRFAGASSFRTFLFAVARNVLLKHFRGGHRAPDLDFGVTSIHDLAPGPSSVVARRREERLLLEALRHIPVDDQIVLELQYWESMTSAEIAEILEVPSATVRSRLRRAKERLHAELERLATSAAELTSTVENLDAWANSLRATVGQRD